MSKIKESFQSAFEKSLETRKTINEYNKIGIECEVCEKIFFKTHHFTVHRCEEVLQKVTCVVCQKIFPTPSRLRRHLVIHSREKLFECEICKNRFDIKSDLTRHRMVHGEVRVNPITNEKMYKCRLCPNIFRSTLNLGMHLVGHKTYKVYKCRICQRGFSIKYNLKRHLIVHRHRKEFNCETCGKSFLWKISLDKHLQVHVEKSIVDSVFKEDPLSKQNLMLQCLTCSRVILRKSQLQRHATIHPDFKCLVCKEYYMSCKCGEDYVDDREVSKTRKTYSRPKRPFQNPAVNAYLGDKIKEESSDLKPAIKVTKDELDDDETVIKTENDPVVFAEINKPVKWLVPKKEECADFDENFSENARYGTIFIEEFEELC